MRQKGCFLSVLLVLLFTLTASLEASEKVLTEVSGSVYGEYRWINFRDISFSELYLRKVEFALEVSLTEWLRGTTVLVSEWIGDSMNDSDEKVEVDEATIAVYPQGLPLYLIAGKRTQPFGVFENPLITDPLTQEAYETKTVGITLGVMAVQEVDLSLTLYSSETQMEQLVGSSLFWEPVKRNDGDSDELSSFVVSARVSPFDAVEITGAYLSEPGRGRRNETINLALTIAELFNRLSINTEYMKAINRELYSNLYRQYRESVFSMSASYKTTIGQNKPLVAAVRYEYFDDDGLSRDLGIEAVKDRFSIGLQYSLYNNLQKGVEFFIATEYSTTGIRGLDGSTERTDEVYLRIGTDF